MNAEKFKVYTILRFPGTSSCPKLGKPTPKWLQPRMGTKLWKSSLGQLESRLQPTMEKLRTAASAAGTACHKNYTLYNKFWNIRNFTFFPGRRGANKDGVIKVGVTLAGINNITININKVGPSSRSKLRELLVEQMQLSKLVQTIQVWQQLTPAMGKQLEPNR